MEATTRPNVGWLPDEVERDEGGDVRYGSVKRVASAVGADAIAVQSVHEYPSSEPRHTGVGSGSGLAPVNTGG